MQICNRCVHAFMTLIYGCAIGSVCSHGCMSESLIRCVLVTSLDKHHISGGGVGEIEISHIPRAGELVIPHGEGKEYQVKQVVYTNRSHSIPAKVLLMVEEVREGNWSMFRVAN